MNDTAGITPSSSSALVVAEKRPHRPGGCVGIFFQLFDWNRRFAKKKLFSKKLLPPARAKQASKKFGANERMPVAKLLLIADENSGGFPSVKNNGVCDVDDNEQKLQKREMRAPGLVARLMGLESMPAVQREKPMKGENPGERVEKLVGKQCGPEKEDLRLEKRSGKHELRPQKIQKTGLFERRAVTRFGAEALQFKSVLSRSKKHHPKLTSPVKSPRTISQRSASRLIDAATKILEPGLHAKSRAKSALTYSNYIRQAPSDEVVTEGRSVLPPDLSKQSGYHVSVAQSLKGHTSCKNCGNLLDVVERSKVEERRPVYSPSDFINVSPPGSGRGNIKPTTSHVDQDRNVVPQKNWGQSTALVAGENDDAQSCGEVVSNKKFLSPGGQSVFSQHSKHPNDNPSSAAFKYRSQPQNQVSSYGDRLPPRSKLSNLQSRRVSSAVNAVNGAKDFVALNRSLSGRTRPRMSSEVDNCKSDIDRKSYSRRDISLSQPRSSVRKRRTINVGRQVANKDFMDSTSRNQRNCSLDAMSGTGLNASSTDRSSVKSKITDHGGVNTAHGKNTDVVSFTFSSPMRHKARVLSLESEEKRRNQNDLFAEDKCQQKTLILDEKDGHLSSPKQVALRGDALGALLEQKLKELAYQEEDELGKILPKRSAAVILQELISALSGEELFSRDGGVVGMCQKDNLPYGLREASDNVFTKCHIFNTDVASQAETKEEGISVGLSKDGVHLSPGSVFEASFSNDSVFSSSLDDSSGHRLQPEPMDYYDESQALEPDSDLLDSATSLDNAAAGNEAVADLVNRISRTMYTVNLTVDGLPGSKLSHAQEVIMNAELLFRNVALCNWDERKDFLLVPFLLGELETLAGASWTGKEGNQLRTFIFDCVIECLDSIYGLYCKSGFRAWTKLLVCMNKGMLICEVEEEIRRWTRLAGKIPDEIIESEMSHSLGKWTDFGIEAFEIGVEIGSDLLQILVDEVVMDLCECRLGIY